MPTLTAARANISRPIIPTWGRESMPQSPSLQKLSDQFLQYITSVRGYSLHTAGGYRRAIDAFRAFLKGKGEPDLLSSFTEVNVQEFAVWVAEQGVQATTVVSKLTGLSSFAIHLMKRRDSANKPYLLTNPTKSFDWPTVETPETHFLHRDELRAFLEVSLPANEAVTREVLFDTGVRAEELCRANVGDLVEFGGAWALSVIVKGRGTRKRKVHMPLSPGTADMVRGFLLQRGFPTARPDRDAEQPLLVNSLGGRWSRSSLGRFMERIAKVAGIDRIHLSPHKIRHTINVVRDNAGIGDYVRSRMLGQSSVRSQDRYRHLVTDDLIRAKDQQAEGLAKYLGEQPR